MNQQGAGAMMQTLIRALQKTPETRGENPHAPAEHL